MNKLITNMLLNIISKGWCKETSYYEYYDTSNPSYGQCAVTALIVNSMFGGKIIRKVLVNKRLNIQTIHYYNVLDSGRIIDLTLDQFNHLSYELEECEMSYVTRGILLNNKNTLKRYELLYNNIKNLNN